MNHPDLSQAQWKKSSRSSGNGQCVEVAHLGDVVATRDSKDPNGPVLFFSHSAWINFVYSAKTTSTGDSCKTKPVCTSVP